MTKPNEDVKRARDEADVMLVVIAARKAEIGRLEAEYAEKVGRLKESYAGRIAIQKKDLAERDALLMAHMKRHAALLFAGGDSVYLRAGELVRSVVRKVAFPKSREALIALLEKLGFTDVVKVKKSCDTDAIEKWPDEQLSRAGLKRKPAVETFGYSLTEQQK